MSRVAVVTGGTRGIGAAISRSLHKIGYKVAAIYHGNENAAQIFTTQTAIPHFKFDVGDFAACQQGLAKIQATFGPVDVLVNNAGITRDAFLHKMKLEQWSEVIRTNLDSVFNMSRLVIEGMRERGFGRIINISSINGQAGQVGQTNYSAAKAAIIGFTKALALEAAAKGITVNAVAPGYIDTEMVRAMPPEVLEKIIAKIPRKAEFATGATFTLNGGQYLA
jgi:acetoacetyl-CoA reductase